MFGQFAGAVLDDPDEPGVPVEPDAPVELDPEELEEEFEDGVVVVLFVAAWAATA